MFNLQCFGDYFVYDFVANSVTTFFLPAIKHRQAKFCLFFWHLAAASFTAKISSFETVAKLKAILNPVPKQWIISKDIPSYGSQSERAKSAIH